MPSSTLTPARASGMRTAAAGGAGGARTASPRWLAPAKVLVFAAGLYPLARLVLFGLTDRLSANPIEFITRSTGLWTLVMLCITLTVTPIRRVTGVPALLRFRRMIGLFAFFYATLHFTTYLWFDKWFDVLAILKDVGKRPFITVGFAAFVLLIPLAATSPRAMVRRLGRHWTTLHRAIYAIALLGVLHFWWMRAGKHNLAQPKLYATIVAVLLGWRLLEWGWRRIRA
ncbi:sulfoxide reductase heme-binding subunit YedZ [Burkholderia sp. MSMB0856]|uniref:protein-methionine-sulfoxide reductase heme-binding subunit MsrQ n=1 Tax=Burkholderia sp. MSMB0856 TaxID=1637869 RepID=UPI00075AD9AF|nr:protein-methionine-sulfoxide reductase heme-binding subunit MsrQ [Burkholderia sp. MSMB0856]AOJ88233.1 sulfoxide reductase heme-binding subunit YedZ [Burkholderia sp. MSMB0856]KVH27655.1 sulfoxide reductase heme-binding subunit YedZ [Burkholderia sp. MSMB0856]